MKTLTLMIAMLWVIPAQAEADEIDSILDSGANIELTAGELSDIFKGVENESFSIDKHSFLDVAGVYANRDLKLSPVQIKCAISQLQALKQVEWSKFGAKKVKIAIFTKKHLVGNSLKSDFQAASADPAAAELNTIQILHVYHPEHDKCDYWDKAKVETQLSADLNLETVRLAKAGQDKLDSEKLAQESKEKKQRLIELLQKTSLNGRAPAVAPRPGECDPGQTICTQQNAAKYNGDEPPGRQPAFLGVVKSVD